MFQTDPKLATANRENNVEFLNALKDASSPISELKEFVKLENQGTVFSHPRYDELTALQQSYCPGTGADAEAKFGKCIQLMVQLLENEGWTASTSSLDSSNFTATKTNLGTVIKGAGVYDGIQFLLPRSLEVDPRLPNWTEIHSKEKYEQFLGEYGITYKELTSTNGVVSPAGYYVQEGESSYRLNIPVSLEREWASFRKQCNNESLSSELNTLLLKAHALILPNADGTTTPLPKLSPEDDLPALSVNNMSEYGWQARRNAEGVYIFSKEKEGGTWTVSNDTLMALDFNVYNELQRKGAMLENPNLITKDIVAMAKLVDKELVGVMTDSGEEPEFRQGAAKLIHYMLYHCPDGTSPLGGIQGPSVDSDQFVQVLSFLKKESLQNRLRDNGRNRADVRRNIVEMLNSKNDWFVADVIQIQEGKDGKRKYILQKEQELLRGFEYYRQQRNDENGGNKNNSKIPYYDKNDEVNMELDVSSGKKRPRRATAYALFMLNVAYGLPKDPKRQQKGDSKKNYQAAPSLSIDKLNSL